MVREIERALYELAPRELAMEWDNVGLLVGSPDREVGRQFVELAVREEAQLSSRLLARLGLRKKELCDFIAGLTKDVELPRLTDGELEGLLPRWESSPNIARTPGDFTPEKQRTVLKNLFQ